MLAGHCRGGLGLEWGVVTVQGASGAPPIPASCVGALQGEAQMYLRTHPVKHRARCDGPPLPHSSTRGGASPDSPACRGHGVGMAAGVLGLRNNMRSSHGAWP